MREDWERQGSKYVRSRRVELSKAEYTVVRFALALLSNNEIELRYWATPEALESARRLQWADALRGGFTTEQGAGGAVRLQPVGRSDSWQVTVAVDKLWQVTAIQP